MGRETIFFLVQLTTSRIDNFTWFILTLAICDDHTYYVYQGASDPPLTEKRLVRFLAIIRRSAKPGIGPLRYSSRATEALRRANSTREKDKRMGQTYRERVRARARKWNDDDRELAEREVAGAILERQHVSA